MPESEIIRHVVRNPIRLTSDVVVRHVQGMGGDYAVVAAAKVSTCGEDAVAFLHPEAGESNAGLINYLMKMGHGTPFEHGASTFYVHAPIFVWREWHRHRVGFSYNEESARYRPIAPLFWIPRRSRPMVPVEGWKPGRPKFRTLDEAYPGILKGASPSHDVVKADDAYRKEVERDRKSYQVAYDLYLESIESGIALEVARSKLPVAIYSSCWVTCNPRSLMHFLSKRTHDEAATFPSYPQAEIEEAARICEDVLSSHWPITHAAFCRNGRVAP